MISRRAGSLSNGFSSMIARLKAGRTDAAQRVRRTRRNHTTKLVDSEQLETRALLAANIISSSFSQAASITLNSVDTAAAGDDLTVNTGITVESTAGSVTLNAGDNLDLQTSSMISAATSITLNLDAADADAAVGSTATLAGQFSAASAVVVTGGADNDAIVVSPSAFLGSELLIDGAGGTDSFEVDLSGVTNPVLTLLGTDSFRITSDSHSSISLFQVESVAVAVGSPDFSSWAIDLSAAADGTADNYSIAANGAGALTLTQNGQSVAFGIQASAATLPVTGSSDDDSFTVDHSNGVVGATIAFDGAGGTNRLRVIGDGAVDSAYSADAAVTGNGTVSVTGAGDLTFTNLGSLDITGMSTATVSLPGLNDAVQIDNSLDGISGAIDALSVGGTTGGVTISTAAFYNNGTVVVDTSTADGDDTITINSGNASHANSNLQFVTGMGTDAIVLGGSVSTTGTQTYSDPVALSSDVTLTASELMVGSTTDLSTHTLTVDTSSLDSHLVGIVSGSGGIAKAGAGYLKLDAANTYSGVTSVSAGEVWATNSSALGATGATSNTIVASGAELFVTGNFTISEDLALAGQLAVGNANSAVWSGPIVVFGGSAIIDTDLAGSAIDVTGIISGSGGLTKQGAGQANLSAVNTYTGTTTVQEGTLVVNGQLADGAVVNTGATLMGAGTIGGAVTVASGATLAPGNSPGIINTGDFDLQANATLTIEIDGKSMAGTDYDQVNVTGTVTLAGSLTIIDNSTDTGVVNDTITLINNDGTDAVSGTFNGLANGSVVNLNGESWRLLYNGGDGNDVVLVWGTPTVSIADASIAEGDSGTPVLTFTVTADSPLGAPFRVTYATADNSADASDYTSVNATLNFDGLTAGETQSISIDLTADEVVELDETFLVTLTNILDTTVVSFSDSVATGTITNDDSATVSINDVAVTETDSGQTVASFTVTLDGAVDTGVSLSVDTADDSATVANSDYVAITGGNLAFAGTAGETMAVSVSVNGDTTEELDESFFVNLSNLIAGGRSVTFSDAQGTATIIDDDRIPVEFSASSNAGTEAGTSIITLTATAASAVSGDQTFGISVSGTNVTATDYSLNVATITIADGQTTGTATFTVSDDAVVELTETATISLVNPSSGVRIGTVGSQDVIISDNDTASLTIADVSIAEANTGTSTLTFTVTLNNAVDTGLTVDFATADDLATVASGDYTASNGTLTFLGTAAETQTLEVQVAGDSTLELDETFLVNLLNLSAGGRTVTLADAQATGTITNDDSATLSINDVTATEGDAGITNLTFNVTLTGDVDSAVSVDFATADDTATTADSDYTARTGTIAFGGTSGETLNVTIQANGDTKVELAESFLVNLSNISAAGRSVTFADSQGQATISNDDTGELVELSVDLNSGSEVAGTVVTLTATAEAPVSGDQTVDIQVTGVDSTDFMLGATSITILDGQSTGTTTLTVIDDSVVELLETATVTLVNPSIGLAPGTTTSQVVSFVDNDFALVSINDVSVTEGDAGTSTLMFTVTLDSDVDSSVTLNYATANSSATVADGDYADTSGTLTFAGTAGETQTISVTINGDATVEQDETFVVNLSSINSAGRNVTFADNQGRGTIANDDSASLTINNVAMVEGDSGPTAFVFTVTLDSDVDTGVLVDYATANGTATTANNDYTGISGNTLAFSGNAGETQTLQIQVTGDTTIETDESFVVNLSNIVASGRSVAFGSSTGTGTILDDDGIAVELSASATTGTEAGTTTVTLTATAATAVPTDQTVDLSVSGVSASDYSLDVSTITILAGQTTGTATFTVTDDAVAELTETAVISLTNPSLALSLGTTTAQSVTITDNDSASFAIGDISIVEGDAGSAAAVFTVTLTGAVDTGLSLDYATADGSATTADSDYAAASGTLNFAGTAGETMTISVDVTGDSNVELNQAFTVGLSALNNAGRAVTIADAQATGTITNDDTASLSIADVQLVEGDSGNTAFTFTVTLDNAVDSAVMVNIDTADGTATVADSDYTANTGSSLSFTGTAGETQTFTVQVTGDTTAELNEAFAVNLSSVSSAGRSVTISDSQAVGTITDDDGIPVNFAINTAVGTEAGTSIITLIASADSAVTSDETIDLVIAGTGITADDYSLSATSITILNGTQVGTVTLTVADDMVVELTETAQISITNPSIGISLGTTTSQTLTLESDDTATISISDVSLLEGNSGTTQATFNVTLTNAVDSGFTVDYSTADNTATVAGGDYTSKSGTLSFSGTAGETQAITIDVAGDTDTESDESFFVNLTNLMTSGRAVTILDSQGEASITDDDTNIEVNLSANVTAATELSTTIVTLTVTADQAVVGDQTVTVQISGADVTSADYLLSTATITIPNGQTMGTATFTVNADNLLEGNETAEISIVSPTAGIVLGTTTSVDVTIEDYTPAFLDPISSFPGDQPTVSWQPVSGAARYEIWFARIFPQQTRIFSDTNITTTSWTTPNALASGFYRYWIRAFDAAGNASKWSSDRSFEVRPTLISPVNPTFDPRPTFTWDAIPFAPGYEIFIRTTTGDTIVDNISGTSFTPTSDLPNGPVRWWIRSSDAQANRGWSLVGLTDIDRRTTVTGPATPTTDTTPQITWQQIDGAGRYIVYLQNADTNTLVLRDDNVLTTSYSSATPLPAGNYRVWVKAIEASSDAFSSGLWSTGYDFSIVVTSADSSTDSPLDLEVLPALAAVGKTRTTEPTTAKPSTTAKQASFVAEEVEFETVTTDQASAENHSTNTWLDALMAKPVELISLLENGSPQATS